ncbi:hypothetical protein [Cellulomonas wangsupingiae]|uniref:hypothetical protein n=1 Tax=Cellulomonas wangsupingiae TaxID=2968085 RepID=UPI001D0F1A07|nr:hypothetical protein [Cellulomonas wangsupingiae]MCM0639049.1 hypothetical protein [Cellulomonas wangsupingiae]
MAATSRCAPVLAEFVVTQASTSRALDVDDLAEIAGSVLLVAEARILLGRE